MLRGWKDPEVLAGALVFSLAFVYLYWIAGDILQMAGDEGIYLEGGRRVALGQQPYRDFFVLTGPLTFWIEGALAYWSGMSLAVMRVPVILDAAFLAWAVYWFTSRYAGTAYSAGTAFAFLAYESRVRLLNVNHRWDSAALATAAIVAALAAQSGGRRGLWALSGFLALAAAWATPSLLVVTVPLLVWCSRRSIHDALAFLGGGTVAAGAAAGYLESHGALVPMIQSLRWTGANYTAANRVGYGDVWLGTPAGLHISGWNYILASLWMLIPALLPPAALAGWVWLWRKRGKLADAAEIPLLLAAAAALVLSAWPRWTAAALLHTMAVSWFLCALLLHRAATPRQRFWLCGVALVASAASVAVKSLAPLDYWPRETRVGTLRDYDNEGEFLEQLERWVKPGDSLFSFPILPSAYYFLNARNPSRYSFLQPGMMNGNDERRAVADLRAAPPRWVIYEKYPAEAVLAIWPGSDKALIPMAEMNGYIAEHYRKVDEAIGQWGRAVVMERIPGPP